MAFDAFMVFEGSGAAGNKIEGETTDKVFGSKKALEILSFSWGCSNPSTIGSAAAGGGAGKVSISSFNIMKKTDNASPNLFKACCQGDHFDKATVTLRKAGGDQKPYLVYEFEEVYVDSVQWSGSSGGDDTPAESVSFSFGKVTTTYTPQTAKGGKGTDNVQSWDLRVNAPTG